MSGLESQYQLSIDEEAMILVFVKWCMNHDLDPVMVYQKAYPAQEVPIVLMDALQKTVPEAESMQIPLDLLVEWLCSYGNDELAFVLTTLQSRGKTK